MDIFTFLWLFVRVVVYTVCTVFCVIDFNWVSAVATFTGCAEVLFYIFKLYSDGTIL